MKSSEDWSMLKSKAQTSVEFLLLVAFGTLIFIVFFAVIQDRIIAANNQESGNQLDRISDLLVSEFDLAQRFDNGYEREFWLPLNANGKTYNLTIKNNKTLVLSSGGISNLYFFDYQVHGQLNPGINKVISVFDEVYLNQEISDILTVNIDGSYSDWDALTQWYGVTPLLDLEGDEYSEVGPTPFIWDIKKTMLWNDQEFLYFYIELYDANIDDYDLVNNQNLVDFLIFLNTDADLNTGYSSGDFDKVILGQGSEYLIPDQQGEIDLTNWKLHNTQILHNSRKSPYHSDSTTNFDFSEGNHGPRNFEYEFIDSKSMELKVNLESLGLDADDKKIIGYTIVARANETGVADYAPGSYDQFTGGYYRIQ